MKILGRIRATTLPVHTASAFLGMASNPEKRIPSNEELET